MCELIPSFQTSLMTQMIFGLILFMIDTKLIEKVLYDMWKIKKDIGCINNSGYLRIGVSDGGIGKDYLKHRFIFECFHGKINDAKLVVDHMNNIKIDNRLENLQSITQSQNIKKEHRKGENLPPIRVQAINTKFRRII